MCCLNELVADALELVPDSLEYLTRLRTPEVYRFCAIPQVMAIATLAEVFDNPKLFTGVVKIRKGMAARLIVSSQHGHAASCYWFNTFARDLQKRAKVAAADDATKLRLDAACARIIALTESGAAERRAAEQRTALGATAVLAVVTGLLFARRT